MPKIHNATIYCDGICTMITYSMGYVFTDDTRKYFRIINWLFVKLSLRLIPIVLINRVRMNTVIKLFRLILEVILVGTHV